MSLKPVWLIIASDRDLTAVIETPAIRAALPGHASRSNGDRFVMTSSKAATDALLILHDSSDPGQIGWEANELAHLKALGADQFAHRLEGRDAGSAIQLVKTLAEHATLALDNDQGAPMAAQEFLARASDQQAAFVIGQEISAASG